MSTSTSPEATPQSNDKHTARIAWYKQQRELRFERIKNYLSIYLFILIVYGGALITDYLLFELMAWLLRDVVAAYAIVATWFHWLNVGLALFAMVAALVHGVISTISQVKLDIKLSGEDEEQK